MKILVTAGATREPLDAVRFLSNVSTGATGAALAEAWARRGHAVVLLRGEGAVRANGVIETETFSSATDLRTRLERRLATGEFDAVVMAAAVADYRPVEAVTGKISSDAEGLTVRLVRNEKILPQLKTFAPRPLRVIGFKLTVGADEATRRAAVATQWASGGVDAVVQNDLTEIRAAAADAHPFRWFRQAGDAPVEIAGVKALAETLEPFLAGETS